MTREFGVLVQADVEVFDQLEIGAKPVKNGLVWRAWQYI
jgi:hypothetical protein